jgi:hypothetical protein
MLKPSAFGVLGLTDRLRDIVGGWGLCLKPVLYAIEGALFVTV